jgi:hypothetical protein
LRRAEPSPPPEVMPWSRSVDSASAHALTSAFSAGDETPSLREALSSTSPASFAVIGSVRSTSIWSFTCLHSARFAAVAGIPADPFAAGGVGVVVVFELGVTGMDVWAGDVVDEAEQAATVKVASNDIETRPDCIFTSSHSARTPTVVRAIGKIYAAPTGDRRLWTYGTTGPATVDAILFAFHEVCEH